MEFLLPPPPDTNEKRPRYGSGTVKNAFLTVPLPYLGFSFVYELIQGAPAFFCISQCQCSFNLERVAESISSIIYPQATEKGDRLHHAPGGPHRYRDSLRLSQVLRNLLSNALKFTPSGGSIRLEIRQL